MNKIECSSDMKPHNSPLFSYLATVFPCDMQCPS